MIKIYTLINHEDGDTEIVYSKSNADKVLNTWIGSGTEVENITVIRGEKIEIVKEIQYDYKIKD